ncbi:MAG: LUD domain-containing protein [Propionivibrio sp.]
MSGGVSSARERILGRLRSTAPAPTPLPDVDAWYAARPLGASTQERVVRLRSALEGAHAEVHDVSAANWAERLLAIAAGKAISTLLIGAGTPHGAELESRQPASVKIVRYTESIEHWRDELFEQIDAGLTLARSAIADTGSLIVWPSAAEPRLISLVPSVHFVLLDAVNIHADLFSAMRAERWADGLPTNALLISGPSKTADIQQTLAYGAHGPRELIVLLRHAEDAA